MNKNRLFGFGSVLVGFGLCVVGLKHLPGPAEYRATSEVKVVSDIVSENSHFMRNAVDGILSKAVLTNVIEGLHLDAQWSRRYAGGRTLGTGEAFELLLHRTSIDADAGTKLIDISVIGENPDEAATISGAIARAYEYAEIPKSVLVEIVAPTVPSTSPAGPDWSVGVVCLVCGLLMSAIGFYLGIGRDSIG